MIDLAMSTLGFGGLTQRGFNARAQGRKEGRIQTQRETGGWSTSVGGGRYSAVAYAEAGDMRQEAGVDGVRVGGGDERFCDIAEMRYNP